MLFDKLLAKTKADPGQAQGAGPKPGATLQYNPRLVPELLAEHKELFKLFDMMEAAHAAGQVAETASLLETFGGLTTAHILKEDFRLYVYLENALVSDPRTRTLVKQFHQEMDSAGKGILAFLAKYRAIAVNAEFPDGFAAELAELGSLLKDRIEREERILYPMYLPAY